MGDLRSYRDKKSVVFVVRLVASRLLREQKSPCSQWALADNLYDLLGPYLDNALVDASLHNRRTFLDAEEWYWKAISEKELTPPDYRDSGSEYFYGDTVSAENLQCGGNIRIGCAVERATVHSSTSCSAALQRHRAREHGSLGPESVRTLIPSKFWPYRTHGSPCFCEVT